MSEHRFRLARKQAGLTLGQAALMLGTTTVHISAIENDQHNPSPGELKNMADVYGVNVEWMMGTSEQHDYAKIDSIHGAEKLSPHDRDVIAQFAASMPKKGPTPHAKKLQVKIQQRVKEKKP